MFLVAHGSDDNFFFVKLISNVMKGIINFMGAECFFRKDELLVFSLNQKYNANAVIIT